MSKIKQTVAKENAVQAILIADTFEDEFVPISIDVPLCLFPVVNKPLIDYTLEFLSLGGVEETFLFCCNHVSEVKAHINKSIEEAVGWTLTMRVNIIVSESCRSFGDCLRDLDAKGLLRGDFVLLEPGVISNVNLLALLKKHSEFYQADKGIAMTLVYQESALGHASLCPEDETLIAFNNKNRVLFHKKTHKSKDKKTKFPLNIFLENSEVSIRHNLKDTHIAICSSSVLPLFSDNFDFQTKDDFIKGLLINEEIMGSTIYCHILKGSDYGSGISNWRMYQAVSLELKNNWVYPIIPPAKRNKSLAEDSICSVNSPVDLSSTLYKSIIGSNVVIGKNVTIRDAFIFDNVRIEDNVIISLSVIGPDVHIKKGAKVTAGTVLGKGVVIEESSLIENTLVQAKESVDVLAQPEDKIGEFAYRLRACEDEEDLNTDKKLAKKFSRLHVHDEVHESESESDDELTDSSEELSYTYSPPPDDTKAFFTEVIDSLTRGYEDKLPCDNLILEVNSSRYAYNVTVKEVNYNVIKAILIMSEKLPSEAQYFSLLSKMLKYFEPILKNYIKNDAAMVDCLQAIEDVAVSSKDAKDKWVVFLLKYLYEKDYLSEEAILKWFSNIKEESRLHKEVKPFAVWLQEAEEEESSEEESD